MEGHEERRDKIKGCFSPSRQDRKEDQLLFKGKAGTTTKDRAKYNQGLFLANGQATRCVAAHSSRSNSESQTNKWFDFPFRLFMLSLLIPPLAFLAAWRKKGFCS
jgi:hypothetical protein